MGRLLGRKDKGCRRLSAMTTASTRLRRPNDAVALPTTSDGGGLTYWLFALSICSLFVAVQTYYRIFYIAVTGAVLVQIMVVPRHGVDRAIRGAGRWIVLFAYLALTSLWAQFPGVTTKQVLVDLIFFPIWVISYTVASSVDFKKLTGLCLGLPVVVACVLALIFLRFGAVRPQGIEGLEAFGATANVCVGFVCASLPFMLWRLYCHRSIGALMALALAIAIIGFSQSRAGILSGAIAILLGVVCLSINVRQAFKRIVGFVAVVAVLVVLVISAGVVPEMFLESAERMKDTSTDIEEVTFNRAAEDYTRKLMYYAGYRLFLEHPIQGIGYKNLAPATERDHQLYVSSHCLAITLMTECGIPGTLLFVWATGVIVLNTTKARGRAGNRPERAAFGACLAAMVTILFHGVFHAVFPGPIFAIVFGWSCALADRSRVRRLVRAAKTCGPNEETDTPAGTGD